MIKIISTFLISVFLMSNFAFASQLNVQLEDQKSDIKALNVLQATQEQMTSYDATQIDGEFWGSLFAAARVIAVSSFEYWAKKQIKKMYTTELSSEQQICIKRDPAYMSMCF